MDLIVTSSCVTVVPLQVSRARQSAVELRACDFPKLKESVRCGKLAVFENRAIRNGRMIALNIVVLPALSTWPEPDPVFYLAGGPGQAAAKIVTAGEDMFFDELRRQRDLIFIDMRGTGDSNGLQCDSGTERMQLQSFYSETLDLAKIDACREKLQRTADLKQYNTPTAIDDLEEIRVALGYDEINLYGISYGSQAALEYLRRFSAHVRTATLAGAITPAAKFPLQFARGAENAFRKLFQDCAEDQACSTAYPNLSSDLTSLVESLTKTPARFTVTNPATKTIQPVQLSHDAFVARLSSFLYSRRTSALIPLVINKAAQGNWSPFAQITARSPTPSEFQVYLGAYLSATCAESVPFIDETELTRATMNTFIRDYRTRRHQEVCAHWTRGQIDPAYFDPVQSVVPTLILSGDIDPATPAEFGTMALRSLPNGRQVVLRKTPHNYTSPCAITLTSQFIARASAKELDATCAKKSRRPPFATELPASYNR